MWSAVVYVLTGLAAVVVVLTRLRLGRGARLNGRVAVSRSTLNLHTVTGALALVTWSVFLLAPDDTWAGGALVGIVAIGLWWVVGLAGLAMLVRWLPARGRHAVPGRGDAWSEGPWLSLLAHLGMALAIVVFTLAYLRHEV